MVVALILPANRLSPPPSIRLPTLFPIFLLSLPHPSLLAAVLPAYPATIVVSTFLHLAPPVTRLNRNCRDFASYTRYSRHDSPFPNGRRKIGIIITLQFFPLLTGVTGVTSQFKSHGYMYRLKKGYPTIKIIRSGRNRGQEGREKIWRGDVLF